MAISDLIADSLTRIRNAQRAMHENVEVNNNSVIDSILKIMKSEGFIQNYVLYKDGFKNMAKIELKYYQNKPVIRGIERISKPGKRIYRKVEEIDSAYNNIGINIFSTSKGIMTGKEARLKKMGGEYICKVW